ncbi:MAG: 23S rRNA (pseudouridine(1915)-N(3))-methyltransferase RlmH [Betaproteobacteria bacterium]|nr:23S rRNA (pseudouridine(1915)-N(3))-methyltransferase RlmH [Betaproteobacteria bacterium]
MRLTIVALGHRMPAWVDAAVADYAKRLPREWSFAIRELKPAPRDRGRSVPQVLAAEAEAVLHAARGAALVACDERGAAWTTRQLADRLAKWRDEDADVAFAIGSADGLAPEVKAAAKAQVALSAMTLPHGLVRVLLTEQLYRAHSLLSGHPYHRE